MAESDYHYDANTVGDWTLYQFRMYTCDKKILSGKQEFGSYEAAKKAVAKMQAEKLQTFKEPTE